MSPKSPSSAPTSIFPSPPPRVPNELDLCDAIKNSQDEIYGGFPGFWDNYTTFVWLDDTAFALDLFYECDLLSLLDDNITITHPPNSPYIRKVNFPFTALLLSITFVVYLYSSRKKTSVHLPKKEN